MKVAHTSFDKTRSQMIMTMDDGSKEDSQNNGVSKRPEMR